MLQYNLRAYVIVVLLGIGETTYRLTGGLDGPIRGVKIQFNLRAMRSKLLAGLLKGSRDLAP